MIEAIIIDNEIKAIKRLEILFDMIDDVKVIATESDANKAIDTIIKHKPDIVFLDIEMPVKSGIVIIKELNEALVFPDIVFVTAHEQYAIRAIKEEAFDYLLKPVDIDDLKETLERYKQKSSMKLHKEDLGLNRIFCKNEINILKFISDGLSSKEIGEKLFLSHHTIDTYRRQMLEKTNTKNSAELVKYALKKGII